MAYQDVRFGNFLAGYYIESRLIAYLYLKSQVSLFK